MLKLSNNNVSIFLIAISKLDDEGNSFIPLP
jgi:hypothetical protein